MQQSEQIRQTIADEIVKIQKLKKQVEKSLRKAPEGALIVSKSNGVPQFFHKTESGQKKGKYIEKKKSKFISLLAQKEYDISFQKELERQENKLKRALRAIPQNELEQVYDNLTEARKPYVMPYVLSDESYVKEWISVPYEGKNYKNEFPKYTTEKGEKVRSKSEKIIADLLYQMGIPYRYEYPLYTKGYGTIYPDFTILITASRKEVYLELFGMMDNPEYCEKALQRIQELARNGIMLGKNLYVVFESLSTPMDTKLIKKMLEELCYL